jgi:hydroxyacylglutathione hydrolase
VASREGPLQFPFRPAKTGDSFPVGDYRLEVLATPGHTPEHLLYLLVDPSGTPVALFSGGALMVGSAARTDLLGPQFARPLARALFEVLHGAIQALPDEVQLLPTHGGGSFCGVAQTDRRWSTLGEERSTNPVLRAKNLDAFLSLILEQRPYPRYFDRMRSLNASGAPLFGGSPPTVSPLSLEHVDRALANGAELVDLRPPPSFDRGHVPGAYSIGLDGAFSAWAGWVLPPDRSVVFVSDDSESVQDAARQLFRIGYDRIAGYLEGGVPAWASAGRPVRALGQLDSTDLARRLRSDPPSIVIDVREADEFAQGHIPGSVPLPLSGLCDTSNPRPRFPSEVDLIVHCAHGHRSAVALSLLERAGYERLVHAPEGFEGWRAVQPEG